MQYAAAARIPLIKSPSLRVPRPVVRPPDIHPLPDDVTAYFVYPFTLEPHVLRLEDSRRATLAAHAARREAYLKSREEEKERRKREALHRIAPGFEPQGSPLVPLKRSSMGYSSPSAVPDDAEYGHTKSVMEDLVDHLAALDTDT
ncbi:uncharacterized protein LAESUDRAFT_745745 [Laetiporus sulphureus 93-53]|uniref:Uncharacterized protein n=1 Tax=Laetiporus sulphureus 93-53 TaxID=1314785 RepID=A0A165BAU8_9APHY|nr:uncharacterized protein LAESUDRAFT_745745 [Laetiporus sulphureus 93-53]KZT00637.1 hypothetical protein LAESUDRAFT_745745 [Laetiporus sulphureus 93-53]